VAYHFLRFSNKQNLWVEKQKTRTSAKRFGRNTFYYIKSYRMFIDELLDYQIRLILHLAVGGIELSL
jgi:hypothetical protein